jgi:hypothetical protein
VRSFVFSALCARKSQFQYATLHAAGHVRAFVAMQSVTGGVYYAARGTYSVGDYTDVSTENNVSLYAGLTMLETVLTKVRSFFCISFSCKQSHCLSLTQLAFNNVSTQVGDG